MPLYSEAERVRLMAEICNRLERGMVLKDLCEDPALPSRPTVLAWARRDPAFAGRLAWSRRWGVGRRFEARQDRNAFNQLMADRLVERVRAGEPIPAILREPSMPNRRRLNLWRQARPDFDRDLAEARRAARPIHYGRRRTRPKGWDEALADRIVLRVSQGAPLPQVLQDRALPGPQAVKRWRRLDPDFDQMLKAAMTAGHRTRGRRRSPCTPELTQAICDRIRMGASLHSLSKEPGMPGLFALYKWVRTRPDFARAVQEACKDREDWYLDQAYLIAMATTPQTVRADALKVGALHQQIGRLRPYPGEGR